MTAYTKALTGATLQPLDARALYPSETLYPSEGLYPRSEALGISSAKVLGASALFSGVRTSSSARTQALAATLAITTAFTKRTARALTAAVFTPAGSVAGVRSSHALVKALAGSLRAAGTLSSHYLPEFLTHPSAGGGGVWFHNPFAGGFRAKTPRGVR